MKMVAGVPVYLGRCRCREWILAIGRGGRCGRCGEGVAYSGLPCCDRIYQCPGSGDVECPEHGGFDTCCDHPDCPGRRS